MAHQDCDHIVLRPGELHTVMAQLRTIGTYIDSSGLDLCWVEADLYGTATVKQIIEGRHVKRAIQAHMTSLQALFKIYGDVLFDHHPDVRQKCEDLANELKNGCQARDSQLVQDAHSKLQKAINDLEILQLMKLFTEQQGPLGKAMLQYMQMVLEMAMYIRAVRTANWELHLEATECFLKYFFAHDKLNYARLIPVYVADMKSLPDSDPDIYREFISGNWVVNKNSIPFCAIGADHALEQVNRMMNVSGGLVGITQNPNALAKFFLAAPELSNIANEAHKMAGLKSRKPETHHDLSDAATSRQERDVSELTNTIR